MPPKRNQSTLVISQTKKEEKMIGNLIHNTKLGDSFDAMSDYDDDDADIMYDSDIDDDVEPDDDDPSVKAENLYFEAKGSFNQLSNDSSSRYRT